ncbi:MAG TPA: FimV/HubP family polar landmark protein, partial [Gammaproteobacteria bacterium]|nr:FimV/HubP family polar landmark protein [Gammaproteobacteria bacterium]
MVYRWAVVLASLTLLIPTSVSALGLGDINVHSGLNQPLNAEIELLSVSPDELDTLAVTLASDEAFEQAGIERPFLLTQLRFKAEQRNGKAYLRVYTQEPIKEPFLNYLIEVNWPSGHLLREYTVLLDPPSLMVAQQAPLTNPTAPATADADTDTGSPADTASASDAATAAPAATSVGVSTAAQADGSYGPTRAGEGLWGVAGRLRPDASITIQQMMLALLKANPEAFLADNVNSLKAGYTLRVPDLNEIDTLTQEQAVGIIKQHNNTWKNRPAPQAKPAQPEAEPVPAAAEPDPAVQQSAPAADATQAANPQLKLVAPLEEKPAGQSPGAGTQQAKAGQANPGSDAEKLGNELTLVNEALEAKTQENDELRSRLTELEQQTAAIQRLLKLKDDELAVMQSKLNEIEAGQQAAPVSAPSPATAVEPPSQPVVAQPSAAEPEAEPLKPAATAAAKPALDLPPPSLTEQLLAALRAIGDEVRANPLAQGLVAAMALLLLSLLWVVNRRRRINNEVIEAAEHEPLLPINVVQQSAAVVEEPQLGLAEEVHVKAGEADLLAEANVYLAYERYDQAEERLRLALSIEPHRHEIHLKLLEIYHITQDKNAFASQAEALHSALAGHEDSPLWAKAVALGKEVYPEHPLFGGTGDKQDSAMSASAAGMAFAASEEIAGGATASVESAWLSTDSMLSQDAADPLAGGAQAESNDALVIPGVAVEPEQNSVAEL